MKLKYCTFKAQEKKHTRIQGDLWEGQKSAHDVKSTKAFSLVTLAFIFHGLYFHTFSYIFILLKYKTLPYLIS